MNSYHELNPLIRTKELELLTQADFDNLLNAPDLQRMGQILHNTHYSDLVYQGFEHKIDQGLAKDQASLFDWLVEVAPEKEVVWIYTMRFTFHNLKVLTKAQVINKNLDHLFVPDGFYSLENLKAAIQSGESDVLPPAVMDSIREVRQYFVEATILQGIDVIYDREFLRQQRILGDQLGYPDLLEEIIAFIDLTNLITLGRGLRQGRTVAFMTTVLSSSGSIEKTDLLQYVEGSLTEFIAFLKETEYGEVIAPAITDNEINFVELEKIKDNYLSDKYLRAQVQAFGPLPLLAFLNTKEVERKNLQLIVTGKRNGIAKEVIRERMRATYD
ncbi:V-type ATPase subunit [Enterococcus sp. HY326]|uniref:V-type ATPase subunit n=1 Tax=Enterococcus sp. HY326 TaxID=2971265 RepID=UPI003A1027C8